MSVDGISSDKHMSTNISLSMGTLSSSCFDSLQAMWVDGVSQMTGTVLDGSLKYIISETGQAMDQTIRRRTSTSVCILQRSLGVAPCHTTE